MAVGIEAVRSGGLPVPNTERDRRRKRRCTGWALDALVTLAHVLRVGDAARTSARWFDSLMRQHLTSIAAHAEV